MKALAEKYQKLKNEFNRFKGEQGQPEFKPNKKKQAIFLQRI